MFRFSDQDRETFKGLFWVSIWIPIVPIIAIFFAERWRWAGFLGVMSAWLLITSFFMLLVALPPDIRDYILGFIIVTSSVLMLLISDLIIPFALFCFFLAIFTFVGDFTSMPACRIVNTRLCLRQSINQGRRRKSLPLVYAPTP